MDKGNRPHADNSTMTPARTMMVALLTGLVFAQGTPALAAPQWQWPLWFEWFSPQRASVDPLEGKTGGITGPGMGVSVQEGSLSGTAKASRVQFETGSGASGASGGVAAAGAGLPAFRKPVHPARPKIERPTPNLSWGAQRHPRPPAPASGGGGKGAARTFTPTERPLLTLPSGKEAWNTYRPDGSGTIDIKNPRPGTPKPNWANHLRP